MIVKLLIVAAVLIYLRFGCWIFKEAVDSLGGKQAYKIEIMMTHQCDPDLVYGIAFVLVVIFWPFFLFKSWLLYRSRRKKR